MNSNSRKHDPVGRDCNLGPPQKRWRDHVAQWVIGILAVFLFMPAITLAEGSNAVYGTIYDTDGTPISGVNVQVDGDNKAVTGDDGKWEIANLAVGAYNVVATKKLFDFVSTPAEVTFSADNSRIEVRITVGPPPIIDYSVYGTIFNTDGTPLDGVNVQADSDNKAVTGDDGKWEITDLSAGIAYNVVATKKLFDFVSAPVIVTLGADNSTIEVKITVDSPPLPKSYTVHGTITDADGNALAGVDVQVDADNKAVTGDDGVWEITDLLEGDYTVIAEKDGYTFEPAQVEVNLTGDETSFQAAFIATEKVVVGCGGITDGLVACYPFDGNANDASGNGNDGTVNGATLTEDRFGNADSAYSFNGINNFIQILDTPSLRLNTFTVSTWVYQLSHDGTSRVVINKGGIGGDGQNEDINHSFFFSDKDAFRIFFEENNGTDHSASVSNLTNELPIQTWHHVVGTYDSSNLNLYVNGNLKETTSTDAIPAQNSLPLIIGKNARSDEFYYFGSVDDVRIYNRALSEDEIKQLYQPGEPTGEYAVYGTIRDELGNKLEGVEVQAAGQTVTTDAAGNWEVSKLQEGEYTVTASKDNYTFAPENVGLGNDEFRHEVVIVPLSKLKVKVVADPRTVKQNDNVTYIATVVNGGDATATGVVLTNVLPANAGGLISIEALDGGECNANTVTCTLPNLTTGNSAKIKLVVSNTQAKTLLNTATVTANEYPADVQETRTRVIPYLSASITDSPDPLQLPLPGEQRALHYDVATTLSANAPSIATGVNLVMTLPKGVELQAVNSDFGMCDSSNIPTITCQLTDLSVNSPADISHVTVGIDVTLKDAGLLALMLAAKVSANEYPVHTDRERTKIFIDPQYKVDIAIVFDDSGSMQGEINQVKAAIDEVIDGIGSNQAPLSVLLTFGDEVKYRAVTQDMTVLRDAVAKIKASGGGTCPEASFEAISFAIPHVKEGGTILFATDASPYEGSDVDDMLARLRSNGIIFNAMVFGDCANPESWNEAVNAQ